MLFVWFAHGQMAMGCSLLFGSDLILAVKVSFILMQLIL